MARDEKTAEWNLAALAVLVAITFAVAAVGGMVTAQSVETWYPTLRKPGFTPPDWIFGPVWSALYLAMAVAAWRVWRTRRVEDVRLATAAYAVQLFLNLGWSIVFFGLRRPDLAAIEVAILLSAILVTMRLFWRADRLAGLLLMPYAAWVCFAAVLTLAIWQLN